ncbi:MAG: hypothetical protein FJY65_09365 [Calditrichaeota bacterium]|nr:hypothetical protein [Calditrichota bacterium]
MTPTPRPRERYVPDDPERRTRLRLDLLIALMVVQIVLSIGLWVDRYKTHEAAPTKAASVETKPAPVFEPEPLTQSTPTYTETQPAPLPQATSAPSSLPPRIKVQVLNGCGVPGVAKRARDWLARQDYDIRDVGNADKQDYRISKIVNRSGNLTAACELARLLGIDEAQITRQSTPTGADFDLTLIVGKDYKRLPFAR